MRRVEATAIMLTDDRGAEKSEGPPPVELAAQGRAVVSFPLNRPARVLLTPAPVSTSTHPGLRKRQSWQVHCRPARPVRQGTGQTMNVLPFEKQVHIISALTEGCSIRSVERIPTPIAIPSCGSVPASAKAVRTSIIATCATFK